MKQRFTISFVDGKDLKIGGKIKNETFWKNWF